MPLALSHGIIGSAYVMKRVIYHCQIRHVIRYNYVAFDMN